MQRSTLWSTSHDRDLRRRLMHAPISNNRARLYVAFRSSNGALQKTQSNVPVSAMPAIRNSIEAIRLLVEQYFKRFQNLT